MMSEFDAASAWIIPPGWLSSPLSLSPPSSPALPSPPPPVVPPAPPDEFDDSPDGSGGVPDAPVEKFEPLCEPP